MLSSHADTVRQIAGLARSGRLDDASRRVAEALEHHSGDPVLLALGGAVEFHRRQYDRAIVYLEGAHRKKPNDLTVRANLAESHFHLGQAAEALHLCDFESAVADPTLRLARLGAHLAQLAEDFATAVRLYRHLLSRDGSDWSLWNNIGNALSPLGDHDGAADALQRAIELAPDSRPIRINLGNALIEAGRGNDAEAVLKKASIDFLDDPTPLLSLFSLYRALGREDDAYAAIIDAAHRGPDSAEIQSDYGQEAARRNLYDVAEKAFEAALVLRPELGPPYVGLASVYERMNRELELDSLRGRAVAAGTDAQSIAYIDALRHKRAEEFDEAFASLEVAGDVVVQGRKHHLRGIMLDRLGQNDEAFNSFTAHTL